MPEPKPKLYTREQPYFQVCFILNVRVSISVVRENVLYLSATAGRYVSERATAQRGLHGTYAKIV